MNRQTMQSLKGFCLCVKAESRKAGVVPAISAMECISFFAEHGMLNKWEEWDVPGLMREIPTIRARMKKYGSVR